MESKPSGIFDYLDYSITDSAVVDGKTVSIQLPLVMEDEYGNIIDYLGIIPKNDRWWDSQVTIVHFDGSKTDYTFCNNDNLSGEALNAHYKEMSESIADEILEEDYDELPDTMKSESLREKLKRLIPEKLTPLWAKGDSVADMRQLLFA